VDAYKQTLRAFGLRPVVHDPGLVNMTQIEPREDAADEVQELNLSDCHEGVLVSKAWVGALENSIDRGEQRKVVECNERALVRAAVRRSREKSDDGVDGECLVDEIENERDGSESGVDGKKDDTVRLNGDSKIMSLELAHDTGVSLEIDNDDDDDNHNKSQPDVAISMMTQREDTDDDDPSGDEDDKQPAPPDSAQPNNIKKEPSTEAMASPSQPIFKVGNIVKVQSRCWPGVNKLGGVGRVTEVHRVNAMIAYDVAYVLGGKEKFVDPSFVELEGEDDKADLEPLSPFRRGSRRQRRESRSNTSLVDEEPVNTRKRKSVEDGRISKKNKRVKKGKCRKEKDVPEAAMATSFDTTESQGDVNSEMRGKHEFLTAEEANKLADEHYKNILSQAYQKENAIIYIITSNINDYHKSNILALQSTLKKSQSLTIKTPKDISALKVPTILITPCQQNPSPNKTIAQYRTVKTMRATLMGIPMVTPDWITNCLAQNKMVMPTNFIRSLPAKLSHEKSEGIVAQYAAALRRSTIDNDGTIPIRPLEGWNVHLLDVGNWKNKHKKNHVNLILKDLRASVINKPHAVVKKLAREKVIFLCDEDNTNVKILSFLRDVMEEHVTNVVLGNTAWLFGVVSCGRILSTKDYEPQCRSVLDLWERCGECI